MITTGNRKAYGIPAPLELVQIRDAVGKMDVEWCLRFQDDPIGFRDRLQKEDGAMRCSIQGCTKMHADIPTDSPDYAKAVELARSTKLLKEHRDKEMQRLEKEALEKEADFDPWPAKYANTKLQKGAQTEDGPYDRVGVLAHPGEEDGVNSGIPEFG